MKISKAFLSQIIKEEIKNLLYEDEDPEWAVEVINYLRDITDANNETNFSVSDSDKCKQHIKNMSGMDARETLKFLIGKVDPQRLQLAAGKLKIFGLNFGTLPDPIPARSHLDSDLRSADEVEDPRVNPITKEPRKNWVHEE